MAEKDDIAAELKKRHPHYVGAGVSITDVVGDLLDIIRETEDSDPVARVDAALAQHRARTHGESETVNHPAHYNAPPSGVECITVTEHMTFNVGNAVKYLWRAGHKGSTVEDLKKAAWYVQREIERLERKP